MDQSARPDARQIENFWNRYLDLARKFRVNEKAIPWYRKHVEEFIDNHPGKRLGEQQAGNVQQWFEQLGRNGSLAPWQYRQKVDALRLLFSHMLRLSWCSDFDWDYWLEGGQGLGNAHSTVSRDYEGSATDEPAENNTPGKLHPEIWRKYLASVRVPGYSVNTERSYLGWINRFLRFHRERSPLSCSEPEVASFFRAFGSATQGLCRHAIAGIERSGVLLSRVL